MLYTSPIAVKQTAVITGSVSIIFSPAFIPLKRSKMMSSQQRERLVYVGDAVIKDDPANVGDPPPTTKEWNKTHNLESNDGQSK